MLKKLNGFKNFEEQNQVKMFCGFEGNIVDIHYQQNWYSFLIVFPSVYEHNKYQAQTKHKRIFLQKSKFVFGSLKI